MRPQKPLFTFALVAASLTLFASLFASLATAAEKKPIKVYVLAGQSNMDGFGGLEALEHQAKHSGERVPSYKHLRDGDGWATRDDAWITFQGRKGPLSAGYGVGKGFFGVEWDFGNAVGDLHEEKVLLIKCSWGGASIRRMYRPPSSGSPEALIDEEYDRQLKSYEKQKKDGKNPKKPDKAAIRDVYGRNYRRMVETVNTTLADIKSVIPSYDGEGYEFAGFVWFQGFNDQFGDSHKEYATHLANLIRDVRKEFKSPKLPVVVGQLGHGGTDAERQERKLKPIGEGTRGVKEGQAKAVALPEFKGNVTLVPTDVCWDWKAQAVFDKGWRKHLDEWRKIGAHFPYHYLGSPWFFMKTGQAFGKAMVDLKK